MTFGLRYSRSKKLKILLVFYSLNRTFAGRTQKPNNMKKSLLLLSALLCAVVQGSWAQTPEPSTQLEPYITTLEDYFEKSFLDTGIMDWLNSKNATSDDINTAWLNQIDNGTATVGGKTYPAPQNMSDMFIKQQIPGMIWGTTTVAWARLDKIFTSGFYNYLKAGTAFLMKLGTDFFDAFQWIDAATPTGIKTLTDVKGLMSDAWYTIDGHRLSGKPTQKGLYIVNGKKVIVR